MKLKSKSTKTKPEGLSSKPLKKTIKKTQVDKSNVDDVVAVVPPSKNKVKRRRKANKSSKSIKATKGAELLSELLAEGEEVANQKSSEAESLQGFKVIKWKLEAGTGSAVHHLFIKRHSAPMSDLTKDKPPGRTLLCHNVPPYFTDIQLKEIFRQFGNVTRIFIHQKPMLGVPDRYDQMFATEKDIIKGFKVAYVVFANEKHVTGIMEADLNDMDPVIVQKKPVSGIHRWIFQYNRKIHTTSELETSVRKYMENFDKTEIRRKEMEKNLSEPDEDGWVTVTRGGKRASGGLVRSEVMENRLKAKKNKEEKHFVNISRAQMKESKTKHLLELKKKFEEDKQRVALLKQQRKFKPF